MMGKLPKLFSKIKTNVVYKGELLQSLIEHFAQDKIDGYK
jgi:hypothetical protein